MPTSFISFSAINIGTRTNTTLTAPASIADQDILRIHFFIGAEPGAVPTPTPPTGFSQLNVVTIETVGGSDAGKIHLYTWEKRAASESGNYTITHSSTFTQGYMECIRGAVTSGSAEDFAGTDNTNDGAGTSYTALGGTTTVDGSFITFAFACWGEPSPVTAPAGATPTFTERYEPAGGVFYVANGVLTTAGATGNKTATGTDQGQFGGYAATLSSVKAAGGGADADLAAAGEATATFVGQSSAGAALSAPGEATASFTGAVLAAAVLDAQGEATGSFVGKALFDGVLSGAAEADAAFVGKAIVDGVLSGTGEANASFTGSATADGVLSADPGVFVITGSEAGVLTARILAADPGAFALAGVDAELLADRVLDAQPGVFVLTGFEAELVSSGEPLPLEVTRRLVRRLADRVMILGKRRAT